MHSRPDGSSRCCGAGCERRRALGAQAGTHQRQERAEEGASQAAEAFGREQRRHVGGLQPHVRGQRGQHGPNRVHRAAKHEEGDVVGQRAGLGRCRRSLVADTSRGGGGSGVGQGPPRAAGGRPRGRRVQRAPVSGSAEGGSNNGERRGGCARREARSPRPPGALPGNQRQAAGAKSGGHAESEAMRAIRTDEGGGGERASARQTRRSARQGKARQRV